MITQFFAAALLLAAPQQDTDTTFTPRNASRLEVEALTGTVTVHGWERNAVRVRATHGGGTFVNVRDRGSRVTVAADAHRGPPGNTQFEIWVPRSYGIHLEGINMPMRVEGVQGGVTLENMEGDMTIRNVAGDVAAESMSGAITIEGARGNLEISAVNQNIRLTDVRGSISAETVNGSVVVRNADSNHSEVSTVNGYVEYHGSIRDGGRYYLGTHNGKVTLSVPEGTNAQMELTTNTGEVRAGFPVPVGAIRRGSANFTLGSGSARVEVETFNGTINLIRPPAAEAGVNQKRTP